MIFILSTQYLKNDIVVTKDEIERSPALYC